MSGPDQKPAAAVPSSEFRADEVSLDEIDRLLKEDDPEFATQLTELQTIGTEGEVDIESAVGGEEALPLDDEVSRRRRLYDRFPFLEKALAPAGRLRANLYTRWLRFKTQMIIWARQLWLYARTMPKEFLQYLKAMFILGRKKSAAATAYFLKLGRVQQAAWIAFGVLTVAIPAVLKLNLMGIWLPGLFPEVISDLSVKADQVWEADGKAEWVSLYKAFPQEEIEFLFPKIVVNLKTNSEFRNPMGAFEFYVVMDSQDAALEVQARQKELHDRLQRAIEDQTYAELSSPLGKKRIKDLLRNELNAVLTQGWVKDVLIKTMVLKP